MPGAEQNSLQQFINNVLPINSAPGKRNSSIEAIEINRACPQIWTQNVSDDEFNADGGIDDVTSNVTNTETASAVSSIAEPITPG